MNEKRHIVTEEHLALMDRAAADLVATCDMYGLEGRNLAQIYLGRDIAPLMVLTLIIAGWRPTDTQESTG